MFGKNEIVGKTYFTKSNEAKEGKLLVTSMFYTLQGEGPYRGQPAFFIRLAKCNLACSFCDTFFDSGTWMSVEEIAAEVDRKIIEYFSKGKNKSAVIYPELQPWFVDNEFTGELDRTPYYGTVNDFDAKYVPEWASYRSPLLADPSNRVEHDGVRSSWYKVAHLRKMVLVITGGEPTLQANLLQLLQWGEGEFENTQIESNGIAVSNNSVPDSTTVVVSPKCSETMQDVTKIVDNVVFDFSWFRLKWDRKFVTVSEMVATKYLKPKQEMLDRADCLKFVMEAPALDGSLSPYASIPDWAHAWAYETGKPVFISPMNIYNTLPAKAKELRANNSETTIDQRSYSDEVVSFWEPGLLDMEANQRNHEWSAKYAITHGFIFNVQIHLLASLA